MKRNLPLTAPSPPAWIDAVMADFDSFLQDHADCERKASGFALSMVAKYPDRAAIIPALIDTALEEMEHFKLVYERMAARGVPLAHVIPKDYYMEDLLKLRRTGREEHFLDRLCIGSVVESRGAERFRLVEEALEDPDMKRFYKMLWTSEAKHGNLYVDMALEYFPENTVYDRLHWFNEQEGQIVQRLDIRAALH
ncbi:MAG: tRNA-(ms[2]io[6]A)-hydroxylase [Saprospiraceae bacterium]|nr:tRNA-(ms[2]io[6]A)-hydroxylase [Saprospiraceae bacterium]